MKKKVLKVNNMCDQKIPQGLLERAVCNTFLEEGVKEESKISLALVNPEVMRELNLKYTQRDSLTDVLAFPLRDSFQPTRNMLGEIIICPRVASDQAQERGHAVEEELLLLTIHGTLHLLGYTDTEYEARRVMEEKERSILKRLGRRDIV